MLHSLKRISVIVAAEFWADGRYSLPVKELYFPEGLAEERDVGCLLCPTYMASEEREKFSSLVMGTAADLLVFLKL